MLDSIQGYPIRFIQKASPKENDAFDFCRIYRTLATKIIGEQQYEHYQFKEISSYLLVKRKKDIKIESEKERIKAIFMNRYDIEDIS